MITTKDLLALRFVLQNHISALHITLHDEDESVHGEDTNDLVHYLSIVDTISTAIEVNRDIG